MHKPDAQALFADAPIPLEAQIAEVRREIAMRIRVYGRWVEQRKMKQSKADAQIELMRAVEESLKELGLRDG